MLVDDLASLPKSYQDLCEKILAQPLLELTELQRRTQDYMHAIEGEASGGAFVDLALAKSIGAALDRLLSDLAGSAPTEPVHRAVQLAVLYFEEEDDAEPDGDSVLGFEDDAHVLNAVLHFVNRPDLLVEIP